MRLSTYAKAMSLARPRIRNDCIESAQGDAVILLLCWSWVFLVKAWQHSIYISCYATRASHGTSELLVRHTRTAFSPDDAHVCPPA
jgi:hypothetical protein